MRGNIPDPYLTTEKGDNGLEWSKLPGVQYPDIYSASSFEMPLTFFSHKTISIRS